MKNDRISPPRLFLSFFRWFCHPRMLDYIEGDLLEVYDRRFKERGKRKADWGFIKDVLLLFRPGIIRPRRPIQSLTPYGMYRSYFKIGWRTLVRNKQYAVINVAGLTLSLICCMLIFTLIKHHLAYDDFHKDSDRIYRIVTEMHQEGVSYRNSVPSPLGETFRDEHTLAEEVSRVYAIEDALITVQKENEVVKFKEPQGLSFTEASYFNIFNFPIKTGNISSALSAPNTAVLTERLAEKYFGVSNAIGETIWLNNTIPFTITGILENIPANTDFKQEIFVSYPTLKDYNEWLASPNAWGGITGGMYCYALLRPNVSASQVEEVLKPYVKKFRPDSKNVHHYKLQPLSEIHFDGRYGGAMGKSYLWGIAAIGIFLLLTACVNFVNLATAQALKRSKEVGVRKVMGSLKGQLFWQFISETAIINVISIFIAGIVAYLLIPLVNNFFSIDIQAKAFLDGSFFLFAFSLMVLVTFLAGFYPSFILTGFQPIAALKGKLSQQQLGGFNTRRTLIVLQFAISQVLIIGVLVILNQMRFTAKSEMGFDKEAILMVQRGSDSLGIMNSLKDEFLRIPGVEKVSLCYMPPASVSGWNNSIRFDNSPEEVNFLTNMKLADVDYLSTFGLELVAGKNLSPSDTVREVLVNETLLKKLGLGSPEDALGKLISANGGAMNGPIVGVVKDFHDQSFHQDIGAVLIATNSQLYEHFAIKLNPETLSSSIDKIGAIWQERYPEKVFEYEFLDESIASFYQTEETILKATQFFSLIAIFIGCLGLYGLVSFMVTQKTKEVGIRKVMGGGIGHIIWLFGKEFVRLVLIAFVIAAPIGWYLMGNWLKDFEYKIQLDIWTFIMAIVSSLVIAALTVGYQVVRAAVVNPAISLKTE